jgi:hypothetical protein
MFQLSPEFWSFNFGHLVTLLALGLPGVGFLYTIRGRVDNLNTDMTDLKAEVKKLVDVMISQGKQETALASLRDAHIAQGKRLDEFINRMNTYIDRKLIGQ